MGYTPSLTCINDSSALARHHGRELLPGGGLNVSILAIGLKKRDFGAMQADLKPVLACLENQRGEANQGQIIYTQNVPEAINLIAHTDDVAAVIVDSRASKQLLSDATQLLGCTPITTRVIILLDSMDLVNRETLAAMGIVTLDYQRPDQALVAST